MVAEVSSGARAEGATRVGQQFWNSACSASGFPRNQPLRLTLLSVHGIKLYSEIVTVLRLVTASDRVID
jgi:hypothetical protein